MIELLSHLPGFDAPAPPEGLSVERTMATFKRTCDAISRTNLSGVPEPLEPVS